MTLNEILAADVRVAPRHLYVGAVALLARMHSRMGREERDDFDNDGDPMARLAADFNACGFGVRLIRTGLTWIITALEDDADGRAS